MSTRTGPGAGVSTRRSLTTRLLGYGASRSVIEALLAGRGLALAAILGAELFGGWALFRIGLRYAAFAGLGSLRGLELQAARAGADGERGHAAPWGEAVAAYSLAVFGPISAALAVAAVVLSDPIARVAIAGLAGALIVNRLWTYGIAYSRVVAGLRQLALLELVNATLQIVLVVGLALVAGLAGALTGFAVAHLIGIGLLRGRVPLRPAWDWERVRTMIRIGFPVSLAGMLTATLVTADRLVVGALLGVGALGIYAFGIAISELALNLAVVVRTVILRDVYAGDPGRTGRGEVDLLGWSLRAFSVAVPAVGGGLALILGPVIILVAPGFVEAIPVAQTLVFTASLQGIAVLAIVGVVARQRQASLPLLGAAGVVLNVSLAMLSIHFGAGLTGVALASLSTRLLYVLGVLALLGSQDTRRSAAWQAVAIVWPTVWCAAAALTTARLLLVDGVGDLPLALAVYAAALLPLIRPLQGLAHGPRV